MGRYTGRRFWEEPLGEAWKCPTCGLMVTEGHVCKVRDTVQCSDCRIMLLKDAEGLHRCPAKTERLKRERIEARKQRAAERKALGIEPTVKMLKPKEEMRFMELVGIYGDDSGHFEEVTVEKNPWKCLACGLVWQTKHEAEECAERKHIDSYVKRYGVRYVENGRPIGGYDVIFKALRKESSPSGESKA